jgi:hypothetical protein
VEALRERAREGDYLGEWEPVAPGIWRWPFSAMRVGDYFTVRHSDKPHGTVQQYAYNQGARLGMRFRVTSDGEVSTVERVDERTVAPQPAQLAAERAILTGGDGDKYLGVLVPPTQGQWSWPFGKMEPGQYFHVNHEDRHPERVRQGAMIRAAQLAIKLSVRGNDPEQPGYARITYVDISQEEVERELGPEATDRILKRCYGTTFDQLQAWHMQDKEWASQDFPAKRIKAPRLLVFVVEFTFASFGLTLGEDKITVTGLPKGTLYAQWLEKVAMA